MRQTGHAAVRLLLAFVSDGVRAVRLAHPEWPQQNRTFQHLNRVARSGRGARWVANPVVSAWLRSNASSTATG
jgi:hypothetical protein